MATDANYSRILDKKYSRRQVFVLDEKEDRKEAKENAFLFVFGLGAIAFEMLLTELD